MDYAEQQRSWGSMRPASSWSSLCTSPWATRWSRASPRRVVEVIKQPLETKIIEEIKKPPPDTPPPPPPKLAAPPPPFIPPPEINIQMPHGRSQAPTITTVTTSAAAARPAAGRAPARWRRRSRSCAASTRPSYRVSPSFPREAMREGISGRVIAMGPRGAERQP